MNAKMTMRNFVDLATDAARRDLTINSCFKSVGIGDIIDCYGGQDDIHQKIFRPVSDHFMEDPVRVLRVARLRARYGAEWKLAPELVAMCSTMSKKGKMNSLEPNRVWKELSRAMMEPFPRLFFDTLHELDCLHTVFPEIYKLMTSMESMRWHPERDSYQHTMLVLTQAANNGFDLETRIACLLHDIGKTLTPFEKMPSHFGHDVNGVPLVEKFCDKYAIPKHIKKYSMYACRYHMRGHDYHKLNKKTIVGMFDAVGHSDLDNYVNILCNVFVCDERGRLGSENNPVDHLYKIKQHAEEYKSVKFVDVFPNGETNVSVIKDRIFKQRVKILS